MKSHTIVLAIAALAGSAMAADPLGAGLVILDQTASPALSMVGNSKITVPTQAVFVNSTSATSVQTSGVAILDCPVLYVRGGTAFGSSSGCTGVVEQCNSAFEDPFYMSKIFTHGEREWLPIQPAISVKNLVELQPGRFHSITISGNGDLRLAPGTYYIENGLKSQGGKIIGHGVTIYMMGGTLELSGNGLVDLSPPEHGQPNARFTLVQFPSNPNEITMSGTADFVMKGIVYAPTAKVTMVGTSNMEGTGPTMGDLVIIGTAVLKGTADIRIGDGNYRAVQLPRAPLFD